MLFLVCRVRGVFLAAALGVLAAIILAAIPGGSLPIPGREGVFALVWPLMPIVASFGIPILVARNRSTLETLSPRATSIRVSTLAAVLLIQVSLLMPSISWYGIVVLRNYMIFFGVSAIFSILVTPRGAWAALVGPTMVIWLLGTDLAGEAKPWAVLLLGPDSRFALFLGASLAIIGVFLMIVFPNGLMRSRT